MLWYLLPIFVTGNSPFNPDYSLQYSLSQQKNSFCAATSTTFYILSESEVTSIILLTKDFNELLRISLEGKNKYEVVKLHIGSEIKLLINLHFFGDQVPGLLGSEYPDIGTTNGLYMAFDFQGNVIKSRWTDFCKFADSKILSYSVKERDYITVKNQCKAGSVCVIGLKGEDPECFGSEWKQVLTTEDNKGHTYYAFIRTMYSKVIKGSERIQQLEFNKELIDFQISENLILAFNDSVVQYSPNGSMIRKFQLPFSFNVRTLFTQDSLFVAFNTNLGFIDYTPKTHSSLILIQLNSTLELINYRGFISASPLQSFTKHSSNFYFSTQDSFLKSEDPFSFSSILNCKDLTKNIIGQCFCHSCQSSFLLLANRCIPDYSCPSNSIKDLSALTCASCYEGCSKCAGPLVDDCSACEPNYALFESKCLTNCPGGYYSKDSVCLKCGSDCLACSQDYCLSCKSNFLHEGSCVFECPEPYRAIGQECQLCNQSNCEECYNGLCNSCQTGFFKHFDQCKECSDNCYTCENEKECIKCKENYEIVNGNCVIFENCAKFINNTCVQCNLGYFLDETREVCVGCSENCEKCSNSACLKCYPGYVLNNSACSFQCPRLCQSCNNSTCVLCSPGYELLNNACIKCPSNCSVCLNSACLQCESGSLHNKTCTQTCPQGYESLSNTCKPCPENCISCSKGLCQECLTNYPANGYYRLSNSTCKVFECFKGYELSDSRCSKVKSALLTFLNLILKI